MLEPFQLIFIDKSWIEREYDFGPDEGKFGISQTAKVALRRNRMLPIPNRRRGDVGLEK